MVAPSSNVMFPSEMSVEASPVAPFITGRNVEVLSTKASLTWIFSAVANERDEPSVIDRFKLSAFRISPAKIVPPDKASVSLPPPKSIAPVIIPALEVTLSSPDPNKISPMIRGIFVESGFWL